MLGVFGAGTVAYSKVIGSLFTEHRGKAFAATTIASTLIASALPQVTSRLLTHFGWRGVFIGYGLVVLVVLFLLFLFLEEPGSMGKSTVSSKGGTAAPRPRLAPAMMEGLSAAEARKSRAFLTIVASSILASGLLAGWMQHSFAYLIGRGFSQQTVVNLLSLSMLISPIGTMLGGWLVDRVQTARIAAPFSLISAIGVVILMMVSSQFGGVPLLALSMTLTMMAFSARLSMSTYFYTRFFGMKAFAELLGLHVGILSLVMGFSAPLLGMLYDRTGSYRLALILMIVGTLCSGALILTLGRYRYTKHFEPMPADDAQKT